MLLLAFFSEFFPYATLRAGWRSAFRCWVFSLFTGVSLPPRRNEHLMLLSAVQIVGDTTLLFSYLRIYVLKNYLCNLGVASIPDIYF